VARRPQAFRLTKKKIVFAVALEWGLNSGVAKDEKHVAFEAFACESKKCTCQFDSMIKGICRPARYAARFLNAPLDANASLEARSEP
jgi:hypothetical protein